MTNTPRRVVAASVVFGLGTLVSHGFGLSLVPAMLPNIEREFQSGYGVLGVAVATGLVAYAVGAVTTSRIMGIVPTRGLLLGTYALSAVGFGVVTVATSPVLVAVAVTVLGVSAPVSWTATIHLGRETVPDSHSGVVLGAASGGATAGVVVNGVLVQTSASLHSWRVSFVIATGMALAVIVATSRVIREPVDPPAMAGQRAFPLFGRVLRDPSGLMIVLTSGASGAGVLVFATFLTATAIDEMGTSAGQAAALLWIGGGVGVAAALVFGRLADRATPAFVLAVIMASYSAGAVVLAAGWSYAWLLVAVVGYGMLNGPVWGLMGAAANRRFPSELGVSAVSLGLAAASLMGAVGSPVAAFWLENTGSMRLPVTVLAAITGLTALYLFREARRPVVHRSP